MDIIALPQNVEFEKGDDNNTAKVIIGPCFPGYGVTLGNALRRVLLSSLPGAAAVGIKIEGVKHEFMALPHLKEDILEFILNIKQLRFKVYTNEVEKVELEVHGKKEITGNDIKKNSNVEVINKDLVLGSITDMAGHLKAEIYVSNGMGYVTIESRNSEGDSKDKKDKEIGYIEMDSIFSPIMSVGIKVENVRVGKMTNWDKLILNLKTDGTITPELAFKESVEILIKQFNALLEKETAVEAKKEETVAEEVKAEDSILPDEEEKKEKRGRKKKE
jgi:DNA-directed RNA polymerase subunit alpha